MDAVTQISKVVKNDKMQALIVIAGLAVSVMTGIYFYHQIRLSKLTIAEKEKASELAKNKQQ